MTANMSFTSAPDEELLGRVAGALGVDEAFVEKDWYVVQAIGMLLEVGTDDLKPVFSGGTSLLKGHGLIRRFSEDIDFKLAFSPAFEARSPGQRRAPLSALKNGAAAAWKAAGFDVEITKVGNANAFFQIDMDYPTRLPPHASLRPHIQVEVSAKPPRLPPIERPLVSFVSQYREAPPEVHSVACVDPVETAADKLSAFCWRMLTRDRDGIKDDPTIVRHLHDLAALEAAATANAAFGGLLMETLVADGGRRGGALAEMSPGERLAAMQDRLAGDELYSVEYERFVGGMAFAGEPEIPGFGQATEAVARLCRLLPE